MEATHEVLVRKVARSIRFAISVVLLAVLAYMLWFGVFNPGKISKDPAVWGQLGDYVGGIANPLIAFLALYWLTQSVLLQRKELQETKDALKESAEAQAKQERHAACAARISALSSMLTSVNADVASTKSRLEFLETPVQRREPSESMPFIGYRAQRTIGSSDDIQLASDHLSLLLERRKSLIEKIEAELRLLEDASADSAVQD